MIEQVVEVGHYTDAESHLDTHASGGLGTEAAILPRIGFEIAHVEIIAVVPKEMTEPLHHDQEVHRVEAKELVEILERDLPPESSHAVVGLVTSGTTKAPLHIDTGMLIGPDGVHILVTGKTRLAGKTSYILFLLHSLRQAISDLRVVIFNVKMSDLLQIHRLRPFLEDETEDPYLASWLATELPIKPFPPESTFYLLPRGIPPQDGPIAQVAASDPSNLPGRSSLLTTISEQARGASYQLYAYDIRSSAGRLRELLTAYPLTEAQARFVEELDGSNWHVPDFDQHGHPKFGPRGSSLQGNQRISRIIVIP